MTYTPPPLGSRIRITFEGIVTESAEDELELDGGIKIELSTTGVQFPSYETIEPGPSLGDLGVYTNYKGERELMMFRRDNHSGEIGWFGHDDVTPTSPQLITRIDPANVSTLVNAVKTTSKES